jgi:hypothetical protein
VLTDGRLISFGCNTVRFSSNSPSILKAIDAHFAHCLAEDGPQIAHYHIAAITETIFSISVDGSVSYPSLTFEQVLQNLMQDALTCLNGNCDTGPVFHAAALEKNGKSIILCGQSGSGKSSLAAWLMANGFRYLTDEIIVYHQDTENISGFPRSLVLKHGSAFIWQRWLGDTSADGLFRFDDGSVWIEPCLFNENGISLQAKPCLLIFPRYSPDSSLHIEKFSPAETLFCLLQNLVNARNISNHGLDVTAYLARQVKAFGLTYSNIESATEWIKQTARSL